MNKTSDSLTDLELVDKYIIECRSFVDPLLLRQISSRGLYDIINYLPRDINEAKIVAHARMISRGMLFGDDQIDQIAQEIKRLNFLQKQLCRINMADADLSIPILEEMMTRTRFLLDYYKKGTLPVS